MELSTHTTSTKHASSKQTDEFSTVNKDTKVKRTSQSKLEALRVNMNRFDFSKRNGCAGAKIGWEILKAFPNEKKEIGLTCYLIYFSFKTPAINMSSRHRTVIET